MMVSNTSGEFDNAVTSVAKFGDQPKTDFAQLIGVSSDNVSKN